MAVWEHRGSPTGDIGANIFDIVTAAVKLLGISRFARMLIFPAIAATELIRQLRPRHPREVVR
ncbi:hypothetical protein CQ12_38880 [Bradyrhizobium jicamae]|uniref:Uncharacterized protein n=1 Tax=Bradyrhizobium jicamae TaxID=280332 RepID=A0A0R3KDF4_9BRAD|nr:hypothetical protein CQ12_38880 [Bradyrhizobium jicamae]